MDSEEEHEDSGNKSSGEVEPVEYEIEEEVQRGSNDHQPEEDFSYQVLSTDQIVQYMIDCIREANVILQLEPTKLRTLLNHFGWDKEKLLESFYDGDQEQLFKNAHVVHPASETSMTLPSSGGGSPEECQICFLTEPTNQMFEMECGHRFCQSCWNEYLTTKIMEEGMGETIACPGHGCPVLVDAVTVTSLLTDPKVKLKYQHLITNSFVQCNRLLRWCPNVDCTHAVRVQYVDTPPVTCVCGFTFCFKCGHARHDPIKCSHLKIWLKKCEDDSETSNWIAANTKDCPNSKCNATIEKNGGCNFMICNSCRVSFCWVCLSQIADYRHNCNRFDETEATRNRSREALQRYLFYSNRYMNHMQSLKFENKLYNSVKEKMEEMQQHNMSWVEVQFLKKAVDILCQCRSTLMYTYAFAFYLVKVNQVVIFEDNQADLESATEKLSEYLERDITSENLADIKQKVQDKYRYCESRRKVLLGHVYEGYEKDWWSYNQEA